MRVTTKIAWSVVFPGCLVAAVGGATALTCLYGARLPYLSRVLSSGDPEDLFLAIMLGALLCWMLATSVLMWIILRRVLRPVLEAERFATALAAGDKVGALSTAQITDDEVRSLYVALNSLRDRQQNLARKFKIGLAREVEQRLEIERYDGLQLSIVSRMLPETRRSLGMIKALALLEYQVLSRDSGGANAERAELQLRLLRKVGALSREIEQVFDLSRLDRERWRNPHDDEFLTAEFIRDLVNRCKMPLGFREVGFSTRYSSGVPDRLRIDRELLFQLMNILIRAVGRATAAGGAVKFGCFVENRQVVFEVRDSGGSGCRENLAEKFNAMLAVADEDFACPPEAGSGVLGLGIVRDIAGRIGCRLEVGSDAESHTVVRFRLPSSASVTEKSDFSTETRPVSSGMIPGDDPRLTTVSGTRRLRVMICDDDVGEADVYARLLNASGVDSRLLKTVGELEKAVAAESCDAVILIETAFDPDELPARLRRLAGRRLPLVVIASQFSEEQFRRLVGQGRVWCLNMPLNYQLLCNLLHQAAGER